MTKTIKIKLKLLRLEPNNFHITVKAKVDKNPVNLVIDTGASHTTFDINFVQTLNQNINFDEYEGVKVGIGGTEIDSKLTILHNFQISHLKIEKYPIILLDLTHINHAYQTINLPEIHGILGSDFFVRYKAIINFEQRELWLTY